MPWYKTGTVKTTINTNAIVGTGTAFIANARVGDAFKGPDGAWYEITNIASDTAMSISPNYIGPTVAAGSYSITPVQGYVKDLADQAKAMILQWGTTLTGLGSVSTENVVPITKGGTGAITAPLARTALGLGAVSTENVLPVTKGGTGANTLPLAQAALGLVPQASISDTGTGRLLKVGAFGMGGLPTTIVAAGTDVNTLTTPGRYAITSASPNMAPDPIGNQYIDVWAHDGGYVKQFAFSSTTSDAATRTRVSGAWSDWTSGSGGGSGLPLGAQVPWGLSEATIPAGWIPRNGQILNRADWPELWSLVSAAAITDSAWASDVGNRGSYSSGNGSTTFRMPDDNGKSPDGLGYGAVTLRGHGKNSTGVVGKHQQDQMQDHKHRFTQAGTGTAVNIDGADTASGTMAALSAQSEVTNTRALTGLPYKGANVGAVPSGGGARSGDETRMVNTTVIWCTVGAGKAVNVGTVDVTALATTITQQAALIQSLQATAVNAYVSFNGTTSTINQSYGVDSVTRNGVGDYTVNFSAGVMTKATYAWTCNAMDTDAVGDVVCGRPLDGNKTTTQMRIKINTSAGTASDSGEVSMTFFGGK